MIKVSFDFDSTLSKPEVQKLAKFLIDTGVEVWITTSRFGNGKEPYSNWNDDLYLVAKKVGIKKENVIFCQMSDKWKLLSDKNFAFHLDDDEIEVELINENLEMDGIWYYESKSDFEGKCIESIKKRSNC